jgi:hypothetical protein
MLAAREESTKEGEDALILRKRAGEQDESRTLGAGVGVHVSISTRAHVRNEERTINECGAERTQSRELCANSLYFRYIVDA